MSDEEVEYEVESVQEAKVEKAPGQGRAKNPKLTWKYRVRWKNYTSEDDTWEPIASFNGSEHLVDAFWERANTGGRDVKDLKQFKVGENFMPLGPPRKKLKRKAAVDDSAAPTSSKPEIEITSTTEPDCAPPPAEGSTAPETSRPNKRRRGAPADSTEVSSASISAPPATTAQKHSNRQRPSSPEIIPDSDEEMSGAVLQTYLTPKAQKTASPEEVIEVDDEVEPHDPLFDQPEKKVPEHIARKENPLVIMVEDPGLTSMEGGISAKTRAASKRGAAASEVASSSRRTKPGPGRSSSGMIKNKSSLLTAEKGALKSVKGRYRKGDKVITTEEVEVVQEVEIVAKPPPTPGELLDLAGLDANAGELSDFEDDNNNDKGEEAEVAQQAMAVEPPTPVIENSASSSAGPSISFPGHNLFSQAAPAPSTGILSTWGSGFKRSTIFGPLSLGLDSGSKTSTTSSRIFLNLDSSVSIPALLVNTSSKEIESVAPKMENKDTPGKFYSSESALTLLGTVRAGGVAAQVALDDNANEDEKDHFKRFTERLQNGDLFVAIAGVHILVFCSAGNTVLSQRLNIPPALHNISEAIVVAQVTVENYSGYADATSNADERRWIQYVATVS